MTPTLVRTEGRISSATLRDFVSVRWTVDTIVQKFVRLGYHLHSRAHSDRCRPDAWPIESTSVVGGLMYSSRTYLVYCQNKRSHPNHDRNPTASSIHPTSKCPACERSRISSKRQYSREHNGRMIYLIEWSVEIILLFLQSIETVFKLQPPSGNLFADIRFTKSNFFNQLFQLLDLRIDKTPCQSSWLPSYSRHTCWKSSTSGLTVSMTKKGSMMCLQ